MDRTDVNIIERYIKECVFDPSPYIHPDEFEHVSYANWAAGEIFTRVADEFMSSPSITGREPRDVIEIIDEFAFDMEIFGETATGPGRKVFYVAQETADDIMYFYIQERGKKR